MASFDLYPINKEISDECVHRSKFTLAFRNVGRTPALMSEAGAKLLLLEDGRMPAEPLAFSAMAPVERSDAVASGDSVPIKEYEFEREITAAEIRRLRDKGKPLLRFHISGFAIYEDVFGFRRTQRFFMKVRQEDGGWQHMRGGRRYNNLKREKISEDEA